MAWVVIANLKGAPGDAAAMALFDQILAKNVEQDAALADLLGRKYVYKGDRNLLRTVQAPEYGIVFPDKNGYVAGGFTRDGGRLKLNKPPILPMASLKARDMNQDVGIAPINGNTRWAIPFVDKNGYVAGGIRKDGVFEAAKFAVPRSRSSATRIVAPGDSLTAGGSEGVLWPDRDVTAWAARLQALLPGVTVFNRGRSGAPIDEIAISLGALPLRVRPAGGQIPASGSVALTTKQTIGWYPGRNTSFTGTLSGVPGTLQVAGDVLSFNRSSGGPAVTVTGSALFRPDDDQYSLDSLLIGAGRNDVSAGIIGADATVADHVVATTILITEYLTANYRQFALWGTITRTTEPDSHANHAIVTQINTRLKALFPGRYIDMQKYLVEQCIHDLGISPTPEDLQNMAAKTMPPSIMDDMTHFSRDAAQAMAVNQFEPYITSKGWV